MASIKIDYGTGGGHMSPTGHDGHPPLATVLRDIADDLADRSAITSDDASDLATAITLVNEIKAAMNNTVRTTKG